MGSKSLIAVAVLILLIPLANAHEDELVMEPSLLFDSLSNHEMAVVGWGSAILGLLVFLAVSFKSILKDHHKKILFFNIVAVIVGVTLYLGADTIYTNATSETGGPVHWHVDYEVWSCGERLDLIDPTGLSNKIGSPVFHEHDDDRVHIEGAVRDLDDVGIDDFFHTIGGHLHENSFSYVTNRGLVNVTNGDLCNGEPGFAQAFLYRVNNPYNRGDWVYEHTKLDDIEDYVPAPFGNVPPGDCIIIEFGEEKNSTERMCAFYEAAINRGELSAG